MRRFSFLLLALLTCVPCLSPSAAAAPPFHPLVVLLVPGTSLSDWQTADAPSLHQIVTTGSLAVMNTRSARMPSDHRRETAESATLTLGTGSRSRGGSEVTDFHPASEIVPDSAMTYGSLYARRTGIPSPRDAEVNVQWPKVQRENQRLGYDLRPGNLGDGLAQHNITVLVGGGPFSRPFACDGAGIVHSVSRDGRFSRRLPHVLVWDAGSLLSLADPIIHQAALEAAQQNGRLVVVSPFVNDRAYRQGARLAPIVVWGAGVPTGLLYSPSTHQQGLITNTDVAPSLSVLCGATAQHPWLPTAALGRAWGYRPQGGAMAKVLSLEARAYRQASGMRILPLAAIVLGVIMICGLICFRHGHTPTPLLWLPGIIIFSLQVSPSGVGAASWAVVLSLACWLLRSRVRVDRLVAFSGALTVCVLAGDTLLGTGLMHVSLLGYSAVEGARYYGLGNEAMGALIGSALVVANIVWVRNNLSHMLVVVALLGLALLLGLPEAGAKAGGLLVAVAAFGTFLWTACGRQWSLRVILCLLFATVVSLMLIAVVDWHRGLGTQSHLGASIERIVTGGMGEALDIIQRKLAVEERLLYHSAWAVLLWPCAIGLCQRIKAVEVRKCGDTRSLILGGIVAFIVCLAVNDAGVVAAALCGATVLSGINSLRIEKAPA